MITSNYSVVAVMSGTSLDGVDLIYATYYKNREWAFKIHCAETVAYSNGWKLILSQLVNKSFEELDVIDNEYSQYLGDIILSFKKNNNIKEIDFVASHGHTALHKPEESLTYQIGNRQLFSDIVKEKVICDFRIEDVEYGGQGAPLVPIGDRLLFPDYESCLNLGGFANISFEQKGNRVAYDICPVNIVLNHYVSSLGLDYDDKGQLAKSGKIHRVMLAKLNALAFYGDEPPKSLGLEWVESHIFPVIDSFNLDINDVLRTYVEHIAIQISKSIFVLKTNVLVTGGGVYNQFLIKRITSITDATLTLPSQQIIEYKEALVFGLLGILRDRNEVNCLKSVTGADRDHSAGKVLYPKV